MTYDSIAANLRQVQERIRRAAERAGRAPEEIQLIAVSKTQPAAAIRAAYEAGQRVFGESYLQEALEKIEQLADLPIEWHFIGRVQANKTRQIAAHFEWVHGLADSAHARRLGEQRPADKGPLNLCLQVNVAGEATKAGVEPTGAAALLELCEGMPGIQVRGFMTLPPAVEREEEQRKPLRALRTLRDSLITPSRSLQTLSMGMSDDLEAAILEGATMVRIGTAIFGARSYN